MTLSKTQFPHLKLRYLVHICVLYVKMPTTVLQHNRYSRNSDLVIVFIDDDPEVIKEVNSTNPDIIILKDTALVD